MRKEKILFLGVALLLTGCSSSSSFKETTHYRDPVTYSFEAYTPHTEEDPLLQILNKTKETTRQIREWEKKHLW